MRERVAFADGDNAREIGHKKEHTNQVITVKSDTHRYVFVSGAGENDIWAILPGVAAAHNRYWQFSNQTPSLA